MRTTAISTNMTKRQQTIFHFGPTPTAHHPALTKQDPSRMNRHWRRTYLKALKREQQA